MKIDDNNPIKLSVVIPCYNCETTISRAVDSVLSQNYENCEVVLVDDGSLDSTPEICDKYANKEEKIKVIHQSNMGLMRAWKNGVIKSSGEYIIFCDADDFIKEGCFENIEKIINSNNPDMILFGIEIEYSSGKIVVAQNRLEEGFYSRRQLCDSVFPVLFSDGGMQTELILKSRWSKCYSKRLLLSVIPLLSDEIAIGEDWLTVFTSVLQSESVYCDNEAYYHYYRNESSMTGGYIANSFYKLQILYSELYRIARAFHYEYEDQIRADQLSMIMLYIKKELELNPEGYINAKKNIEQLLNSDWYNDCVGKCSISRYGFKEKMFASLILHENINVAYLLTRISSKLSK